MATGEQLGGLEPGVVLTLDETPQNSQNDRRIATLVFEHVEGQIARADIKAQLVIAADVLLFASITPFSGQFINDLVGASAPLSAHLVSAAALGTFASLILSLVFGLVVARPIVKPPRRSTLVFFGQIATYTENDFVTAFASRGRNQLVGDLVAEIHAKAKVANLKFVFVRLSIDFLILALVFWAATRLIPAFF